MPDERISLLDYPLVFEAELSREWPGARTIVHACIDDLGAFARVLLAWGDPSPAAALIINQALKRPLMSPASPVSAKP